MKPFHSDRLATIYRGDARQVFRRLPVDPDRTVVITDPVWLNALTSLEGSSNPFGLFAAFAKLLPRLCYRAIVILGCDSDPRFLCAVPSSMPFVRTTWLRYACPGYKGPILNGADVASVFGDRRMAFKGQKVFSGEIVSTDRRDAWQGEHPCPRRYQHVEGLVRQYTREGDTIIDPFVGSGTTIEAAVRNRRRVIACDVVEAFAAESARRSVWAQQQGELPLMGAAC